MHARERLHAAALISGGFHSICIKLHFVLTGLGPAIHETPARLSLLLVDTRPKAG